MSVAGLVAASFVYRVPALLNAASVDSDAAIVGLQARHILRGEWSWFLYGSSYQTSIDAAVAALFFVPLGATPLALLLSTLVGHVVATCLAFLTLARRLPGAAALVAVSPLVLTSTPLHTYILNPPRQAALTLVFAAIFVTDSASRAASGRAELLRRAAGAAIASLACFADPYALLLLPPLLFLGLLAAFDDSPGLREAGVRAAATLGGAALGLLPLAFLLSSPRSAHGETTLTLAVVHHNLALLLDPCLPWLLGATAYVPRVLLGYVPLRSTGLLFLVQRAGPALFLLTITRGGLALARSRAPWPLRRLGGFGFVVAVVTVLAFLVSVMVMDLFSSRYLAALVLMSPFAIAPVAAEIGWSRLLAVLAPYLVAAGFSGWVGFGDQVRGAVPVTLPGRGASDELVLEGELRARGVQAAVADYWVSYRLTFLYDEALPVVPIHEKEDRYAPYRDAYRSAARAAYIFDPKRSREDLGAMEKEAFESAEPWGRPVERIVAGTLTAVVFEKAGLARP
jgi:hypothetical protein